ncbi:LytR/AlgR family response regulator transcription factor [Xanthomarina sp. GH4-25]
MYLIIVLFVMFLAILQDLIYSKLQNTGFYLSESMLYNTFWAFFIPFTIFNNQLIKKINPKNKLRKLPYNLLIGIAFSLLHIVVFTSLFVGVSYLLFTPAHRFVNMFNAAFSNQFYIALSWYIIFPIIYVSKVKLPYPTTTFSETLMFKIGSKLIAVPTASIIFISTDKPYSIVYTSQQKFLDIKSLKEFEKELDPNIFLRVHRSTIINATCIKELKSRSNGDYDVKLDNGQVIRLSRHYRNNWQQLLQ